MAQHLSSFLSKEGLAEVDRWVAKYPTEQKRSAVIEALKIIQDQNQGWVTTEMMDAVADYLSMEPISVYEVATFYTMYNRQPVGKHEINVCTNISCLLCGSEKIADHLQKRLGVRLGETTPDGKFTLREVECLAACGGAPMMMVGKTYHENLTPEKVDAILDSLE